MVGCGYVLPSPSPKHSTPPTSCVRGVLDADGMDGRTLLEQNIGGEKPASTNHEGPSYDLEHFFRLLDP